MKTSALFQNTIFSFFLKRASTVKYCAFFAAYVLCAIGAWGTNYTWTGGGGTDLNWTNVGNWTSDSGSSYPRTGDTAIFKGNEAVTVDLDANIEISKLQTGTGGRNTVTINTNGHTLTSSSFIVNAEFTGSSDTNTVITGGGSVKTETFDFPNKNTHNVTIGSGTTLEISTTLYGNADNGGTLTFKGSGTLYLPASGANVDYGESKITYDRGLKVLPLGEPTYYKVTAKELDGFPSNDITITITRNKTNAPSLEQVKYPYTFTTTNTGGGTFSFNGQNVDPNGYLSIGVSTLTENITLSYSETLAAGDGFTLTIKTPDNSMELAVISYYKDKPRWTGAVNADWNESGNWTGITNISEITSTSEITINSGVSNYPEISTTVSLKSLTITSNAKVTMTGGSLTVDKLICTGNSNFTATGGTVVFGNSETDAEFSADYPDNSSFYHVEVTDGKNFTSSNSMTITGNFTSNGNTTLSSGTLTVGTESVSSNCTVNGTFNAQLASFTVYGETTVSDGGAVTAGTQSYNGAVTVFAGGTITGSSGAVTFNGNVTNDGKISGTTGILTFSNDVTNSGTITAGNSVNDTAAVTFSKKYAGTGGTLVGSAADSTYIDFYGDAEFGTVTVNKSSLRFKGSTAQTLTPNGQSVEAVIFANTDKTTLNGSLTANRLITVSGILFCDSSSAITANAGLTIENTGTLNAGDSKITLSNETAWNNGGTFNCERGTVIVSGSGAKILGNNTFFNFECTTAGAIVKFEAGKTQTVSGNFTITGSPGNKVQLTSTTTTDSWTFEAEANKVNVQYAAISNSNSKYVLAGIQNSDTWTDNGENTNWFSASYIWKGTEDTAWDNAENWTYPNGQAVAAAPQTDNDKVEISIGKDDEPATNTLEVNSNLTLKSITVNSGSTIDLASCSVTVDSFTNYGTVRLDDTRTQSITGTMKNESGSTVEYYGPIGTSLPWDGNSSQSGKNYENLVFTNGASTSDITDTVKVSGTTTIDTGSSDVKLSSEDNIFSGEITVTSGGKVSITAAATEEVKIAAGAKCNSLEINGNTALYGNVTTTGAQVYNGNVTLYADATLTANTTLSGKIITDSAPVVLSSDADIKTLTLTGNSTIQTKGAEGNETGASITLGAVSGTGNELTLTSGTGNITVYGAVGAENSIIGDIIIESAGTVKFTGAIYSTDFTIASAKDVEFESTINCAQLTQTAGSGTSAFLDTVTASGAISLTGNIFTFAKDVTTQRSLLTKGDTILFGGAISAVNDISITGNAVTLQKQVTTNGELSVTHSGIFTIAEEADITADKGFIQYGTGTLAIGGTSSTTSITTKNAPISFNGSGTLTLKGDILLTSSSDTENGGNININTPVEPADNSAQSLTLSAGKGNIYFSSDTVTTKRIKDVSIQSASEVEFTNKLNANKISVTAEKITLTQTAKLDTAETAVFSNSGILLLEPGCSIEASTITQDGSGKNQIAGTITAQEIILKNNTYIYNKTEITAEKFTVGSDTTPADLTDLYISALEGGSSAQVTFNANVSIHGNYALFNGTVIQNGNLSVEKDIILLNGNANAMYKDANDGTSSSGVADLFKYTGRDGSIIAENSLSLFPDKMPDGTTINHNGKYISTFSILPGITISAGQNFYDNGTDLTPVGSWTLKLKANDKATDAFAELYNAKIVHCKVSPIDGGKAFLSAAENGTDADGRNNDGVFFSRPEILVHNAANAKDTDGNANLSGTYTVYDNVIRVEFVDSITKQPLKIENSSNEISAALEHIKFGSTSTSQKIFEGAYTTAECTQSTDGKGDLSVFFLKTANSDKWNTDATGISSGANESTDWDGTHRTAIPYLNIPKALESVWQTLRDEHKNRISHYYTESPQLSSVNETSGATFTATADLCAPVLVAVRTGQELHTKNDGTAESQPFYDSHNFIELQYSEPVNTGNILLTSTEEETVQNTQVQDDFGKIDGTSGNGLTVSGLIKTAAGMLKTGSNGTEDNLVHSLYRKFSVNAGEEDSFNAHRLRISIAGYVDKSVSTSRGSFKHWKGYIDSAETPSGTVTRIFSPLIKDFNGNVLEAAGTSAHKLPELSVSSEESELYGKWDTLPPAFAVYKNITNNEDTGFEAIGTNDTDSTTLDRIEFHVFDNETNEPAWYIKTGWCSESKSLFTPFSYAADIFGGARPFSTEEKIRTSGGLRYASLYNKSSSFSYKIKGKPDTYSFGSDEITGGAKGLVFRTQSEITHATGSEDGLYFSVHFADSSIPLKTTFEVTYNENGFVTDLAGNRMKSGTVTTIDRTAPTFNMSVGAVPDDSGNTYEELYVIFNKKLNTDAVTVYNNDGTTETKQFSEALRESLRFVDSKTQLPVSDIFVSTEKDVDVVFKNDNFTGLKIPLNRSLTYGDIKKLWIQAYTAESSIDPLSGVENANVTYIQDVLGNYLPYKSAHAISDFAINIVNPIYAYDARITEDGAFFSQQMYQDGSWAVHDWNAEQKNYGTLSAGYDLFIEANLSDGNGEAPADTTVFAYFDSTPDTQAVSVTYNENISGTGLSSWRVWLPNFIAASSGTQERSPIFKALSPQNNVMSKQTVLAGIKGEMPADAKTENEMRFSLNSTTMENAGWKSGDQISFLFALSDANNNPVKICHAPEYDSLTDTYTTEESPLFALRLKNSGYLTSVDLWSFKLQDITKQRGGVTIFNNVINAANGEKTVVQVNMPSGGTLNVIVMTLDGNIVKYLQHGEASQGEHNYTWDGTTKSGKKVARGLYFIRVFGNGIDETRKVMVVK